MATMIRWLRAAALMMAGLMALACAEEDDPVTATPPVFSVTPVNMSGAYNPTDSTLGDILFSRPVILPFGGAVDQYSVSRGVEYYTRPGAPVRAVTAGVIDTIITNPVEQSDYSIALICTPGSDYTVYQEHIVNLRVMEHTSVKPGDTLGEAGTWSDTMRRTGLKVSLGEGTDTRYYCPLNYGSASFNDPHVNLLAEYRRMGFTPVFDTLCLTGPLRP
ncbi:MAG: hypothetical protein PHR28_00505 [candidate division Zixibacteria bacterium]|nr:hypothetical protein [candidate division Zixibacteria bacterium]